MTTFLLASVVTFVNVFLKVLQQKNVQGNHYKAAFVTSYLLCFCDVVVVVLIVQEGLLLAFWTGTGAALGGISGIYLHNRVTNDHRARRAALSRNGEGNRAGQDEAAPDQGSR